MVGATVAAGAVGLGGLVMGKQASDRSNAASNKGIGILDDFVNSGKYDPGGSQQSGSGSSWGEGGSSSSSSSSSQGSSWSGYNVENAQELLGEWEETFGGIEDNLSDYYNNLDPAKYSATYKANLYENIDKQMAQVTDSMASQGLMSSGMRAQNEKEAAFMKAKGGAEADVMADDRVKAMQMGFLNFGEGRKNMYDNAITGVRSESQQSSSSSSSSSSFQNSGSVNESSGNSWGSNLPAYDALSGAYQGKANNEAADAAGWTKGGLDMLGAGIGGLF